MSNAVEVISFDSSCHTVDAVQRAAYRFIDKMSVTVEGNGAFIKCEVAFDSAHAPRSDELIQDFRKEVLDQVLRERIRAETAPIRAFVLSLAYSRTGLIDSDSTS